MTSFFYISRLLLSTSLCMVSFFVSAQDTTKARRIIKDLCSEKYHGRGYYKNGAVKAASYIARDMKKAGLLAFNGNFYQEYNFPINVFRKDPTLRINNWIAVPGRDFVVNAACPSARIETDPEATNQAVWIHSGNLPDSLFRQSCVPQPILQFRYTSKTPLAPVIYLIDTLPAALEKKYASFLNALKGQANTITFKKDKLTWSASPEQSGVISIEALLPQGKLNPANRASVSLSIFSSLENTRQRNVIGFIPGKKHADSFIVITAHYDHLGRMGKHSLFPGANDNAAGVAMLLDLAGHYHKDPPEYTMVFIAFSGEEAGLIGSSYYINNPLHPLLNTRFVLNCDLVGTGETGITVVNATVFKTEFAILDSINKAKHYLPAINKRGKAANSDHYFFTELGLPSFFWYQGGPRRAYHDIDDIPETLTLFGYDATFLLAVDFFEALGN